MPEAWARRVSVVAGTLLVVVFVGGCLPSRPSPEDWTEQAAQALADVASELATAQLVLREESRGHLPARVPDVMLVDAEETAGSAVDGFEARQAPDRHGDVREKVSSALAEGTDLLVEVRTALVAHDEAAYDDLLGELVEARRHLMDLEEELR